MSSRLNPREYDLGELRDAVREQPRRHETNTEAGDDSRRNDHQPPRLNEGGNGGHRRHGGDAGRRRYVAGGHASGRSAHGKTESGGDSRSRSVGGGVSPGREASRSSERATEKADAAASEEQAPKCRSPPVGRMRRETDPHVSSEKRNGHTRRTPLEARVHPRQSQPRSQRDRNARRSADGVGAAGSHGGVELLAQVAEHDVERPYLTRLPDEYGAQMEIFEWLEGLLRTCGHDGTIEALEYYESIEWLSPAAREALVNFVEGLSASAPPDPRPLDVEDHRESLRYIARLAHRTYR